MEDLRNSLNSVINTINESSLKWNIYSGNNNTNISDDPDAKYIEIKTEELSITFLSAEEMSNIVEDAIDMEDNVDLKKRIKKLKVGESTYYSEPEDGLYYMRYR